jgi:hypothetical protein
MRPSDPLSGCMCLLYQLWIRKHQYNCLTSSDSARVLRCLQSRTKCASRACVPRQVCIRLSLQIHPDSAQATQEKAARSPQQSERRGRFKRVLLGSPSSAMKDKFTAVSSTTTLGCLSTQNWCLFWRARPPSPCSRCWQQDVV